MREKLRKITSYCSDNNVTYLYAIDVSGVVYFCTADIENKVYAVLTLDENDKISISENGFSLVTARFKRDLMISMGGVLIEHED